MADDVTLRFVLSDDTKTQPDRPAPAETSIPGSGPSALVAQPARVPTAPKPLGVPSNQTQVQSIEEPKGLPNITAAGQRISWSDLPLEVQRVVAGQSPVTRPMPVQLGPMNQPAPITRPIQPERDVGLARHAQSIEAVREPDRVTPNAPQGDFSKDPIEGTTTDLVQWLNDEFPKVVQQSITDGIDETKYVKEWAPKVLELLERIAKCSCSENRESNGAGGIEAIVASVLAVLGASAFAAGGAAATQILDMPLTNIMPAPWAARAYGWIAGWAMRQQWQQQANQPVFP